MSTRSACVITGATVGQVTDVGTSDNIQLRASKLGTLVTGRPGDLVVEYALAFEGPVYDVMWNPNTGWFAVTIYRGQDATRWDNRTGDAGYPRVPDVLGASTPRTILDALDIPPDVIGYAEA